jgi:hypothetical protein
MSASLYSRPCPHAPPVADRRQGRDSGDVYRMLNFSPNFPHYDRNPNTGRRFGMDSELAVADQVIYHDPQHPSRIVLPIMAQPTSPSARMHPGRPGREPSGSTTRLGWRAGHNRAAGAAASLTVRGADGCDFSPTRPHAWAGTPFCFAVCPAMKSIKGGERQS